MEKSETSAIVNTVATINNQQIVVIENGEKRVAVKPICEALGINYPTQLEKLKNDPILGDSTVPLGGIVGADKKEREMQTIPFKYVFGWLFRIDSRKVKPESRESVMKYQMECYDALYNHFTAHTEFVEYRQAEIDKRLVVLDNARGEFNTAKEQMKQAREELDEVRRITFDDYKKMKTQMQMEFPADSEAENVV